MKTQFIMPILFEFYLFDFIYINNNSVQGILVPTRSMTTKMKVIFECSANHGHRTKLLAIHPVKKWVGMINQNNTFSLWNYEEKILVKCFSCNTLDDTPPNPKNPQNN